MHNQSVKCVQRRVHEATATAIEFDDEWPSTDPTGALALRDLDRALARIPEERRQSAFRHGVVTPG
jgi:hypothetical protein